MVVQINFYQIFAESNSVNLSNTNGTSFHPQILVEDGEVYAVWTDKSPGNSDTFFTRTKNGGTSIENPTNLSNNTGISAWPRFVVSESKVFATWYDYTLCKSEIFFAKSTDGGNQFETINLSETPGVSYNPWIASTNDILYVVWNDSTFPDGSIPDFETECQEGFDSTRHLDIFLAKSIDDGSSFDTINLSNSAFAWNPRISVSDKNVYVAWNQISDSLSDIFFSTSYDNGKSFSEPINVSHSKNDSLDSGIQVYGNNVYMVWHEKVPASDIFFAKSNDNGKTFDDAINLSVSMAESKISRDTQMTVSGNNIFLVWNEDAPESYAVFFVRSTDSGKTFTQPVKLNPTSNKVEFAQVVANNNNVYVIWQEYENESSEIFLRESNDLGATFGNIVNLSDNSAESIISVLGPQIALTQDKVYTIWEDKTTEKSDLFLKVFDQNLSAKEGVLVLQTINGEVDVKINIDGGKLEAEIPINFTLSFLNPDTGKPLEHVNYSLKIEDVEGNRIHSSLNQIAKNGFDTQTITFPKTGPMTVEINIEGLGLEEPFDTKYSGKTNAVITVVPEFPAGILWVMVFALAMIVILKNSKSRFKPSNIDLQTN